MSFIKNLIADNKEEIINKIFDDELQKKPHLEKYWYGWYKRSSEV